MLRIYEIGFIESFENIADDIQTMVNKNIS